MNIFVVGSINMDLVINTAIMPKEGETLSGNGFFTNPGGKGANQAVSISKMNGNALMVGCVGKEFGIELLQTLNKYKVNTNFVKKNENISSGVAVIVLSNNDNRIILDAGANYEITKDDVDKALKTAKQGDYVLLQLEIPLDIVLYTLKKGKELGLKTVLNTAPAKDLSKDTFKYIDLIITNQSEANYYTDIYPSDEKTALEAACKLANLGVKEVIITLGSKGSTYFDGKEIHSVNAFKENVVDTTSAGDTYIGCLLTKLQNGLSMVEAMKCASAAAAICVTRKGAQMSIPFYDEVDNYLETHTCKKN